MKKLLFAIFFLAVGFVGGAWVERGDLTLEGLRETCLNLFSKVKGYRLRVERKDEASLEAEEGEGEKGEAPSPEGEEEQASEKEHRPPPYGQRLRAGKGGL